jgi:phosphoribosylamine--glycine ligase
MYGGFFATAEGVKVTEFNARFGDPECINIMSLFRGSWPAVMERICAGALSPADVPLDRQASLALYLVSPVYALGAGPAERPPSYEFELDRERMEEAGCGVFFASAEKTGERTYTTVGTSRAVALAATATTLADARARIVGCADSVHTLQWRRDVGDEAYLNGLCKLVEQAPTANVRPLLPDPS